MDAKPSFGVSMYVKSLLILSLVFRNQHKIPQVKIEKNQEKSGIRGEIRDFLSKRFTS